MTTRDDERDTTGSPRDAARPGRPATRPTTDVAVERTPVVEGAPRTVRSMSLPGTAGAPTVVARNADPAPHDEAR